MEIKHCERVKGKGIFSTEYYKKDEIVRILEGEIKVIPDKFTIEIEKDKHITDKYGIGMNHSFEPSIKIDKCKVIALKDIVPGDELCFNYNDSESIMAYPFRVDGILVSGKNDKAIKERFTIRPNEKDITINNIENMINYMSS